MTKYSVKFLVKAIVQLHVNADNVEEAEKKAKAIMNQTIFIPKLEVVDESTKMIGYDDDDAWDEMSSQ